MVNTDDPNVALKDLNFKRRMKVGLEMKARLLEQIEKDIRFLESQGITDYSLLVGVHLRDEASELYHTGCQCGIQKNSNVERQSMDITDVFRQSHGGIESEDNTEIFFLSIIDCFTTYNLEKSLEHFAKSMIYDSVTQLIFLAFRLTLSSRAKFQLKGLPTTEFAFRHM